MSTKSEFSSGLAHKVCCAWAGAGGTPTELNRFAEDTDLLQDVLRRVWRDLRPVINCDTAPFVPEGLAGVSEHQKGGILTWNPTKIKIVHTFKQNEEHCTGHELRKRLACEQNLNANVLDWLLKPENQRFIPEEWSTGQYYFFGTIYRYPRKYPGRKPPLGVRFLHRHSGQWRSGLSGLGRDWYREARAVVLAR